MKLLEALHSVQKELKVRKDKKARLQNFTWSYLSLPTLLDEVLPILTANGLTLRHDEDTRFVEGGAIHTVECTITCVETGESTSTRSATFVPFTAELQPSQITWRLQSATTMLRRYTLCNILGLSPDEDDGTVETLYGAQELARATTVKPTAKSEPAKAPVSPQPTKQQATNQRLTGTIAYLKQLAAKKGYTPQDFGLEDFALAPDPLALVRKLNGLPNRNEHVEGKLPF